MTHIIVFYESILRFSDFKVNEFMSTQYIKSQAQSESDLHSDCFVYIDS